MFSKHLDPDLYSECGAGSQKAIEYGSGMLIAALYFRLIYPTRRLITAQQQWSTQIVV